MRVIFMKKIILTAVSLALATHVFASTPSVITASSSSNVNSTAANYQSKTTSSISVAPRDNLIVATTITRWDPKASDTLAIHWIAPKGSYCQSSTFPITRGPNSNHDVFWAYRTVVHTTSDGDTITCNGHWVVQVVNTATGKILTSTSYDVPLQNKPPLSGDTTLSTDNSADADASIQSDSGQ